MGGVDDPEVQGMVLAAATSDGGAASVASGLHVVGSHMVSNILARICWR